MTRFAALTCLSIIAAGCSGNRNDSCIWPSGEGRAQSLVDSVHLAEDLAIRYADAKGKGGTWRTERESCEARLFESIAAEYRITPADIANIRDSFSYRGVDLVVYGPMMGLCVVASWLLVGAARRRFGPSETLPRIVALVIGMAVITVAVIGIGQVWAGLVEVVRIGNGHLSYRADRIPWPHHRAATAMGVALVVSLTLAVQSRWRPAG